jgi:hypothetical protein
VEATGDDEVPETVGDNEPLLRRCGKKDVRADGSVKMNAFIRTTSPLEISVMRGDYIPNPWFDVEDNPSKNYRVRLSTKEVRGLPEAEVRADKPPPAHAVIGCLLEGRADTAVPSKDDMNANEWAALVRLCEKLAKQAKNLGPPP